MISSTFDVLFMQQNYIFSWNYPRKDPEKYSHKIFNFNAMRFYEIDGELDKKEKTELVTRYQSEVDSRRRRIQMLTSCCQRDIKDKLHYAISLISNLEMLMEEAPTYVKQGILGSIFPQKLYFEKNKYRTAFLNSVVKIIYQETKSLRGREKEKEDSKNWMSSSGPREGLASIR